MLNWSGSVRGWWRTPCSRLSSSIWKKRRTKSSRGRGTPAKLKRPIRMAKAVITTGSESGAYSSCSVKSIPAPLRSRSLTCNVLFKGLVRAPEIAYHIDDWCVGVAATQQKRVGCWGQQKKLVYRRTVPSSCTIKHAQGRGGTSGRHAGRGTGLAAEGILPFTLLRASDYFIWGQNLHTAIKYWVQFVTVEMIMCVVSPQCFTFVPTVLLP